MAIDVNTTYVASYFAPVGHYAGDSNYFANGPFDNAPLHAVANSQSKTAYSDIARTSTFPTSSFLATNYFVDPVFVAAGRRLGPPTVVTKLPAGGATGVSTIHGRDGHVQRAGASRHVSFVLKGPGNVTVPAAVYIPRLADLPLGANVTARDLDDLQRDGHRGDGSRREPMIRPRRHGRSRRARPDRHLNTSCGTTRSSRSIQPTLTPPPSSSA